jgi:hypothetical protein
MIWRKRRFENLLGFEEKVNQWLFDAVVLKQMALMLGNVECLKKTSSVMLRTLQI